MTNEERIELCLKRLSMGKTSDVVNFSYADALAYIERLKAENATLHERLNITKMALEYACLETLQSNEQYLEELKEKVNKYIKQSEDVVYGQKNGVTFRFSEARLTELKGGVVE